MRNLPKLPRRARAAICVGLACVCSAGAVVFISGVSSAAPRASRVLPRRLPKIRALLPAQASDFAALHRAREADVSLPTVAPAYAQVGANLDLATPVATAAGTIWLIPANGMMCAVARATNPYFDGGECVSDAAAAEGHALMYATAGNAPGETFVAGIVGNGIANVTVEYADGSVGSIPVQDNVYAAVLTSQPTSVSIAPDGVTDRINVTG